MSGLRCKPGDFCVVIASSHGNVGAFVTVLKWVLRGEPIAQWNRTVAPGRPVLVAACDGWLVKAAKPMSTGWPGNQWMKSSRYGVFADSQLQPIRPPAVGTKSRADADKPVEQPA